MLSKIAQCGRSSANVCRNLHRLIHRSGKTLKVELATVTTPVKIICGKPGVCKAHYPVLHLSAWAKLIFKHGGEMLLGGNTLDQEVEFTQMLRTFWANFKYVELAHAVYQTGYDLSYMIPIAYHGDEGSGKLRRPIMILAHQPIIPYKGVQHTNMSGCLAG